MPILDFENPLYTFDSSHTTYTATQECWVSGVMYSGLASVRAKIDGKAIGIGRSTSTGSWAKGISEHSILRKVGVGQVVTVECGNWNYGSIELGIYKEK